MTDYKTENVHLMHGDCLERMKEIPSGSVDMILTDPPYGTVCGVADGDVSHGMKGKTSWDIKLDTSAMLEQCNRILRPNGALVLFSQDPYTSELIAGAHGNLPFSYRYTWLKDHFANALIAKKAPVNYTEDVLVFFKRHTKHDFEGRHPLREYSKTVLEHIGKGLKEINAELGHRRAEHFFYADSTQFGLCTERTYSQLTERYGLADEPWFMQFSELSEINATYRNNLIAKMTDDSPKVFNLPHGAKYKSNVLEYRKDYSGHHPTQKPVALLEDLLETYTNSGETVLDFTAGSGSTGVACVNTGRKFIGIELDDKYFEIAKNRIKEAGKVEDAA